MQLPEEFLPLRMSDVVTVTGSGQASAVPDVLRVELGVQGDGRDVVTALDAASAALTAIIAALRGLDVASRDLGTASLSIQERYANNGQVVGFRCQQQLTVVLRTLSDSGRVLRELANVGGDALRIQNVALDLSDRAPALALARDAAFADARTRAEQYAELAGRPLGAVLSIDEGTAPPLGGWHPQARAVMLASSAVPIEQGSQGVEVSVTVRWALLG